MNTYDVDYQAIKDLAAADSKPVTERTANKIVYEKSAREVTDVAPAV